MLILINHLEMKEKIYINQIHSKIMKGLYC